MTRFEAWTIRRLLAGMGSTLDGETSRLSEPVKRLCSRLRSLPVDNRKIAWDGFVAGHQDPDEIIKILAGADLSSDPPAEDAADQARARPLYKQRYLCDVEPRPIEWLWEGRIPLGMLTLFAGDPKLGKSLVTLQIAAAVSTGRPLPGEELYQRRQPGGVLMLSAEDDPARTIRPRLEAAGADLSRIATLESVILEDGQSEALPQLARDLCKIRDAIENMQNCRLVIIDPVSAYIGAVDDHTNAKLRGLLSPLKSMAEETNVAVVLVTHLNKGRTPNVQYKVIGSIAYIGACRAAFVFARDPSCSDRILMADLGGNLSPEQPTLGYLITASPINGHPIISWDANPSPLSACELVEQHGKGDQADNHLVDDFLRERLAFGSVPAADIEEAAREHGYTTKQLRAAKIRLGVVSYKASGDFVGKWYWGFKEHVPQNAQIA